MSERGRASDTVVVANAASRGEALVIAALLADNGIRSATVSDDIAGRELPWSRSAGVRVMVRRDQADAARALLQGGRDGDEGAGTGPAGDR